MQPQFKSSSTHSSPRASSVRHSRAVSILPLRPCPTISASSSPVLAKEPYEFQRGDVLRCDVNHARCSSKQPSIGVWSTPTFCVNSRVPPFRVCLLFLWRAFTSARYSTRKSSTSPSPSCRKKMSTASSSGATSPSRDQRIYNFYLRAAISDCLLIGFIRTTETLKKDLKQVIRD